MELINITEKEFDNFALKHEQFTFYQHSSWANLKELTGWKKHFLGYKNKNNIIAASLILERKTPIQKSIFYAPRGFLIDYKDKKLLTKFTNDIKIYIKKHNGFFLKIDPYISYIERDIDGNIIESGENNEETLKTLKELGYIYYGRNKTIEKELQPRWMFALNLNKDEKTIFNNFSKDTKRYINRCEKLGLEVKEITNDNLTEYKKIMEHTAKRRGFIDRPIAYYENMVKHLKDGIKILICTLNTTKASKKIETEINNIKSDLKIINETLKTNNGKNAKVKKIELEKELENLENRQKEIKELEKEYGKNIVMSGSMFITLGNEIIYLFSGSYDYFMKYNAQYLIQWEIIKYGIKNNYKRYNFYGISGTFEKDDPMYGIYLFKRGFDGYVIELLGEFDLVINKPYYYLYKFAFSLYKKIKNIKNKL